MSISRISNVRSVFQDVPDALEAAVFVLEYCSIQSSSDIEPIKSLVQIPPSAISAVHKSPDFCGTCSNGSHVPPSRTVVTLGFTFGSLKLRSPISEEAEFLLTSLNTEPLSCRRVWSAASDITLPCVGRAHL
ncbi:hypothetical protein BDR07DRAFT_1415817, partial [Suillus spraguei]